MNQWVALYYIFVLLLYIDCILIIRHADDGHRCDRNMLVKHNNTWLNIFIIVHLLDYHISKSTLSDSFSPSNHILSHNFSDFDTLLNISDKHNW